MSKKTVINLNSKIYYTGNYWNDIPLVREYICENFTGNPRKWWIADFQEKYASKPFKHALFLNCGDGRFEREFVDKNIVKKVTAFDISPELIKKAKRDKGKRRIKYLIADANKISFAANTFDLVVNIAALHHTQYINRMCRIIASSLTSDGFFVNFDYTGPHRNQYPFVQWVLTKYVNSKLPEKFRKPNLNYPHIPTMLATDPTEAIHSELIIDHIERYFRVIHLKGTGGGIAYEILTHNQKLNNLSSSFLNKHVKTVLKYDKLFTNLKLTPSLFSYIIAQPNKEVFKQKDKIRLWQKAENLREKEALHMRGVYSTIDYLKLVLSAVNIQNRLYLLQRYFEKYNET